LAHQTVRNTHYPRKGLHISIILFKNAVPMRNRRDIRQFGLYGEGFGSSEPEFVHIETISSRSSLHNWAIAPHIHPNIFQLLYLRGGEGVLAVDGAELKLVPPVLVIVPCGCVHAFRFKTSTEGWVLSFADSLVDDRRLTGLDIGTIARGSQVLRLPLDANPTQGHLLAELLADLAQRHDARPGLLTTCVMALLGLLLSLAHELAKESMAPKEAGLGRRIALVRRFSRLVEHHMREQWSVAHYAEALGTTSPTLTRACREVTGKPPGRLVLDLRLREAKRALSYTDASVGLISDELGFSDPAYFARVFRRLTGLTATAYRRERFWPTPSVKKPSGQNTRRPSPQPT
jgi:AraC family transcriptional activator of pobA